MKYLKQYPVELPYALLNILPNPVLVKDKDLKYVWANPSFCDLFQITLDDLVGRFDSEVFPDRQAVQCTGGDLRVLETGEIDEAVETVFKDGTEPRETLTRKSRLTLIDGSQFLVGVIHDVTDVVTANRKLELATEQLAIKNNELDIIANTDVLTGCMNRRAFLQSAKRIYKKSSSALILADLDHFKKLNDTYGHSAGDAALRHFVEVTQEQLREKDQIARIGGEEFAFLLPDTNVKGLQQIGERICKSVADSRFIFEGQTIIMTVSLGGIIITEPVDKVDKLMNLADNCLYRAKENGRNTFEMHDTNTSSSTV